MKHSKTLGAGVGVLGLAVACSGALKVDDGPAACANVDGGVQPTGGASGSAGHAGSAGSSGYAGTAGSETAGRGGYGGTAGSGIAGGGYSGTAGTAGIGLVGGDAGSNVGGSGAVAGEAGAAGAIDDPSPGALGEPCYLGGTALEAQGTLAQAEVTTLAGCNEGLACNATGSCAKPPLCPDSIGGLCVVRPADPGTKVYTTPNLGVDNSETAIPEPDITALTANSTQLFWAEYGTRDALGNYQGNGAIKSVPLGGGAVTTLASTLAGPLAIWLTSDYAYVYEDGAPLLGISANPTLLRLPLSGGPAETVDTVHPCPVCFANAGAQSFWSSRTEIHAIAETVGAKASVFLTHTGWALASDGVNLYYADSPYFAYSGVWSVPVSGSQVPSMLLALNPASTFVLHGGALLGLDVIAQPGDDRGGFLLDQVPTSGEVWQRVRALGGGWPTSAVATAFIDQPLYAALAIVGDRYFITELVDWLPDFQHRAALPEFHYLTGSLSAATEAPLRVLRRPIRDELIDRLWVGTANALYFSDGAAIYAQSL